jgi:hypothetical protein
MATYKPGVCNIGKNEIRKRYALGVVGFVATLILVYFLVEFSAPRLSLVACIIPLFLGSEGMYQGYFRFCAGFATLRAFDFSGSGGRRGKVAGEKAHKLDLQQALKINLYSLDTAAILTLLIYIFV